MSQPPTILTVVVTDRDERQRINLQKVLDEIPNIQVREQVGERAVQLVINLGGQGLSPILPTPDIPAAEFEQQLHASLPDTITLVLADEGEGAYRASVVESGSEAYLERNITIEQFLSAIRQAAHGQTVSISETDETDGRKRANSGWGILSRRERDVLRSLAVGEDNKTIAAALGITVNTVEKHLSNIYRKLGVTSRAEAIRWWDKRLRISVIEVERSRLYTAI